MCLFSTRLAQMLTWLKVTIPCGHVICSPCVDKFMRPQEKLDPHASQEEQERSRQLYGRVLCYVCETDLTPGESKVINKKESHKDGGKKSKKDKESSMRPGLVEISSEGTGFAGKGANVASKAGVAFQC